MLSPNQLATRLDHYPRLTYGQAPTPLERLERLSGRLGGPQLWIKRDDGFGPGMGGNKGRKLEFIMAEALRRGKRKIVTYGGPQSNHARMTAAACAAAGFEAHLFFFASRPAAMTGNLLLDRLFGARMHFIPFGGGGDASMTLETTNRLVRLVSFFYTGPGVYFMPVGGHSITGCLGYVRAALELHRQCSEMGLIDRPVTVVTAAGTGGTLAGLLAGFRLLGSPIRALGIDVGKLWKAFPASIARLAAELCAALGEPTAVSPQEIPLIEADYAGPGYGKMSQAGQAAMALLAAEEGILLDPIYTAKAFAGLIDLLGRGQFQEDEHVIFLHTGGAPGIWAGVGG